MKIRNGFVSNSSSSSFLISYKDLEDFKKFEGFKGYDQFFQDLLNNENLELRCKDHILESIRMCIWRMVDNVTNEFCPSNYSYIDMNYNDLYDLLCVLNIKTNEIPSLKMISDYRMNLVLHARDLPKSYGYSKTYNELEKYSVKIRPTDEDLLKLTNEIYNVLTSKGKASQITYEDDSEFGDYMEHGFMPFISQNPERSYEIHTMSQH